jgi:hypothetical protein
MAIGVTMTVHAGFVNAAVVSRNCGPLPEINAIHSTNSQTGSANNFAPVAGSPVNFTINGNGNSCVIVASSAQAYAPAGRLIWVRALLDGQESFDGQIAFSAEDGNFAQARSYSFLFQRGPPGNHQVFLEYRSQANGQAINIAITDRPSRGL